MSKISNNVEHLDFMLHFLFESFTKTLKKSRIYRKITSLQNIADWRLFFFDCTTLMLFWHDIIPVFCTLKLEMDSLHITLILLHRDLAQSGSSRKNPLRNWYIYYDVARVLWTHIVCCLFGHLSLLYYYFWSLCKEDLLRNDM